MHSLLCYFLAEFILFLCCAISIVLHPVSCLNNVPLCQYNINLGKTFPFSGPIVPCREIFQAKNRGFATAQSIFRQYLTTASSEWKLHNAECKLIDRQNTPFVNFCLKAVDVVMQIFKV